MKAQAVAENARKAVEANCGETTSVQNEVVAQAESLRFDKERAIATTTEELKTHMAQALSKKSFSRAAAS